MDGEFLYTIDEKEAWKIADLFAGDAKAALGST
jgi:hypothetical protein